MLKPIGVVVTGLLAGLGVWALIHSQWVSEYGSEETIRWIERHHPDERRLSVALVLPVGINVTNLVVDWPILEVDSKERYADSVLEDLVDEFVEDDSQLVVLYMDRDATISHRMDTVYRFANSDTVVMISTDRLETNLVDDMRDTTLKTEAITVPLALVLFGLMFRSWKHVAVLAMNLVTNILVGFGVMQLILFLTTYPFVDSTECSILEIFVLAFTTDFTFLILRRFDSSKAEHIEEAIEEAVRTAGEVILTSGSVVVVFVVTYHAPLFGVTAPSTQHILGVSVMLPIGMFLAYKGVPFWIRSLRITPSGRDTKSVCYSHALERCLTSRPRSAAIVFLGLAVLATPLAVLPRMRLTYGWEEAESSSLVSGQREIVRMFPQTSSMKIAVPVRTDDLDGVWNATLPIIQEIRSHFAVAYDGILAPSYQDGVVDLGDAERWLADPTNRSYDASLFHEAWRRTVGTDSVLVQFYWDEFVPVLSQRQYELWKQIHSVIKPVCPDCVVLYGGGGVFEQNEHYESNELVSIVCSTILLMGIVGGFLRSFWIPVRLLITSCIPIASVFTIVGGIYGSVSGHTFFIAYPVVFALALDYDLFIILRIKEYRWSGMSHLDSVSKAAGDTNVTILLAALIMIVTFSGFLFMDATSIKEIGLVITLSVTIDALIVRAWIVPCMIALASDGVLWWPSRPPNQTELGNFSDENGDIPLTVLVNVTHCENP